MKILVKLSPKRLFGSKKSRSHVSRSDPSSFSSSSEDASVSKTGGGSGTPTSVLRETNSGDWSEDLLVSVKELEELLSRLGGAAPSREEVAELLSEVGCDGNGRVSVGALMGRVGSVCGPACDAELRGTFDFFDADGDGRITAAELLGALRAVGDGRCTLEDCRRMIEGVDGNGNGDGFVCFEDFSRMMEQQR